MAEGILASEGANAWERIKGGDGQDAYQAALEDVKRLITDTAGRTRIDTALSHHQNSGRQLAYYRNDRANRQSSLHDAELWSGYAMQELQSLTYRAMHLWINAAELHMTTLQEWLIIHGTSGAQQNINLHYEYMKRHYDAMRADLLNPRTWEWSYEYDPLNNRWLYSCEKFGRDVFHFCTEQEYLFGSGVAISHGVMDKLAAIYRP